MSLIVMGNESVDVDGWGLTRLMLVGMEMERRRSRQWQRQPMHVEADEGRVYAHYGYDCYASNCSISASWWQGTVLMNVIGWNGWRQGPITAAATSKPQEFKA